LRPVTATPLIKGQQAKAEIRACSTLTESSRIGNCRWLLHWRIAHGKTLTVARNESLLAELEQLAEGERLFPVGAI
jgi:hypothetical protein